LSAHQTFSLVKVIGFLLQEEIWWKTIGTCPIDKSIVVFWKKQMFQPKEEM
jgi:hypothetical protein